ncbi:hypothetical protein [Prochlorococcus sp. MIT 1223]|uniref:hypothetical protein n=1 Tax=Prochlorococcus sp. MIT 1223 TaxID=3096217 RepID=UPI002A7575E0|nr:hypothetical protein [Prochlorococcus sp. MIT 1223]
MSINRPSSNKKPGEQSSTTPSGKEVPMAMSMMVDSMVRMIQKANIDQEECVKEDYSEDIDEN